MGTDERRIASFSELWSEVGSLRRDRTWIFRGQGQAAWPLVPKVGRRGFARISRRESDRAFFDKWRSEAAHLLPPGSDVWEQYAIAQHHGLPTRLLDWTYNPLAAIFFAVEDLAIKKDAAIFALRGYRTLPLRGDAPGIEVPQSPFDPRCSGVRFLRPRFLIGRQVRQSALFSLHNPSRLSVEDVANAKDSGLELIKIVIDKDYRRDLLLDLSFLGVGRALLMGDLDAIAQQIGWIMRNERLWEEHYYGIDYRLHAMDEDFVDDEVDFELLDDPHAEKLDRIIELLERRNREKD